MALSRYDSEQFSKLVKIQHKSCVYLMVDWFLIMYATIQMRSIYGLLFVYIPILFEILEVWFVNTSSKHYRPCFSSSSPVYLSFTKSRPGVRCKVKAYHLRLSGVLYGGTWSTAVVHKLCVHARCTLTASGNLVKCLRAVASHSFPFMWCNDSWGVRSTLHTRPTEASIWQGSHIEWLIFISL